MTHFGRGLQNVRQRLQYRITWIYDKCFNKWGRYVFVLIDFLVDHYLPVETGRWNRTDISERKCLLCNKNDTGDELHYLLTCHFFNDSRLQNVPRFDHNNPNILNFKQLMNTHSRPLLVRLCKFIRIIMETLKQLY